MKVLGKVKVLVKEKDSGKLLAKGKDLEKMLGKELELILFALYFLQLFHISLHVVCLHAPTLPFSQLFHLLLYVHGTLHSMVVRLCIPLELQLLKQCLQKKMQSLHYLNLDL